MIAMYKSDDEIIIVGLNVDRTPMDSDGTLFGPHSGRNQADFIRTDIDTDRGQTVHIETVTSTRVKG